MMMIMKTQQFDKEPKCSSLQNSDRFLPLRNADSKELYYFDCVEACIVKKKDDEHLERSIILVVDDDQNEHCDSPCLVDESTITKEVNKSEATPLNENILSRAKEEMKEDEFWKLEDDDWIASDPVQTSRLAAEAIDASYVALCEARSEAVAQLDMCQEKFEFLAAALRDQERALRSYLASKRESYHRMMDICADSKDEEKSSFSIILDAITTHSEQRHTEQQNQYWEKVHLAIDACEKRNKQVTHGIEPIFRAARSAEENFLSARYKFTQFLTKHEAMYGWNGSNTESSVGIKSLTLPPSPNTFEPSSNHANKLARYARKLASAHEAHQCALERFLETAQICTNSCWVELAPILKAFLNLDSTSAGFNATQHLNTLQNILDNAQPDLSFRIQQALDKNKVHASVISSSRPISSSTCSSTAEILPDIDHVYNESLDDSSPRRRLLLAQSLVKENQCIATAHQEDIKVNVKYNSVVVHGPSSKDDETIEDEDAVRFKAGRHSSSGRGGGGIRRFSPFASFHH
eukprot:CAMPEP_0197321868 /NCGR_PEP_ID=MMETSP0891-20130614/66765_1 /TAXON_ID=44058 ORGANISM="Aureoumbra lagunensis, Strain CCMP1510" /NCGR_SAMPLE_ID=MMETSP0891 /ASSEMBLY_ACC=CAM_ASM_000534 /LENGTH=520 /DNA_ID=CAMNT_0042813961 /DNA_START=1 /DNA_END=1563 /DNA_ORIENTATION=+